MKAQFPHPDKGWITVEVPDPPLPRIRMPGEGREIHEFRLREIDEHGVAVYENAT